MSATNTKLLKDYEILSIDHYQGKSYSLNMISNNVENFISINEMGNTNFVSTTSVFYPHKDLYPYQSRFILYYNFCQSFPILNPLKIKEYLPPQS